MKTYVYSGQCRLCESGLPTGIMDAGGNELMTGDIVAIVPPSGALVNHFTVVVADQFTTYAASLAGERSRYEEKTGQLDYYVMGIKRAAITNDGETGWYVSRVKSFADAVHGERWPQYGFNYRTELP